MPQGTGRIAIPFLFQGSGGTSGADERAKVTAADTASDFLASKLVSNDGSIIFTVLNPGGIEQLDLSVQSQGVPTLQTSLLDVNDGQVIGGWFNPRYGTAQAVMLRPGNVIGMSVASFKVITAGSVTVRLNIDGVDQNGIGESISLSSGGPDQLTFLQFASSIPFTAGQVVNMTATGETGLTPSSIDINGFIWYSTS